MMRILALDVGKRRIGVAVSDPLGITARPHSTIPRDQQAIEKIVSIMKDLEVTRIVVGLPLHLNGTEGEQARDVRAFAAKLMSRAVSVEICWQDERLSTVEAEERLSDRRGGWRKKKNRIDAFAAAGILESYLQER
jgi:putative Holliday junction resolvase